MTTLRCSLLAVLITLFCSSAITVSAVPDTPQGFPNNAYEPGQLLWRQVGLGRTTNIIYHNGIFYSNNVGAGDRREYKFLDVNDPSSFTITSTGTLPFMTLHGNHGHTKWESWAGRPSFGEGIRRVSVGVNDFQAPPNELDFDQPVPSGTSSEPIYFPWRVPFNWNQYGANIGRAVVYRADTMIADFQAGQQHGVIGNAILLGNLMFICSDASMLGVACYDLGPALADPLNAEPVLLDKLDANVGSYITGIWENYLVMTGGNDRDKMYVVDISDPTAMTLVKTIDLRGNDDLNAGTNVPYMQTQDEHVFVRRHKINMETFEKVLELDEVGDNRPAGSVTGRLGTSQYLLPVGNLLITGAYSSSGRDGVGVWCHQAEPDTRGPYVGYHIPQDGQTNYPAGAAISLVIAETLEGYTIVNGESVIVRPVGGSAIDCWTSFSHDGILTVTPKQYLPDNTTFEVILPDGLIKDAAGNGMQGYSFTFSTGSSVDGGNEGPQISDYTTATQVINPGDTVNFSASATDPEGDSLEYRFTFGEPGSTSTNWSTSNTASHTYTQVGIYPVKVQVRDLKPDGSMSISTSTATVSVLNPVVTPLPVSSASIALDENSRKVWVANPDNDTVTRINADSETVEQEINLRTLLGVGLPIKPESVDVAANGNVWVTCSEADLIAVLSSSGSLVTTITTGAGSAPQHVAITPDGSEALVTLWARGSSDRKNGQLVKFSTSSNSETGRLELGPTPRAIAIERDGNRAFIARFISALNHGEIWVVDVDNMSLSHTQNLMRDRGIRGVDPGGSDGPGVPNYVSSLAISPDEEWLWYGAIKMATNRGEFFMNGTSNNAPLSHDSTVRAIMGRVSISGGINEPGATSVDSGRSRIDVDNSDSPSSIVFSPYGGYAFATFQGNNFVGVFDDLAARDGGGKATIWRVSTGSAPQGILYDAATDNLWVKNFMSRDVTVHHISGFVAAGNKDTSPTTLPTVSNELLSNDVFEGKKTFYFAGDDPTGHNETSFEGYISCATCHFDGGHDGRVWDFTQRGEGLRNTTDLRGRAGVTQGNVHWSGNFDEIQDFVLDIVNQFGGDGFLDGASPNPSLGAPNAGRAVELDQLSAYVTSLGESHVPVSPYRNEDGTMTAAAIAGKQVFQDMNCASCHNPANGFTDSTLFTATLHDVGTIRDSSGQRLGGVLSGIDTPTLFGAWDGAPYFHDGSAQTLDDVFRTAGGKLYQAEDGSGGSIPGFIDINGDFQSGEYVQINGETLTISNVDGGSGGTGAVEVRVYGWTGTQLSVSVNGGSSVTQSVPHYGVSRDFKMVRFEGLSFNAGTANSVAISHTAGDRANVDYIVVSTSNELNLANPHRTALSLNSTDYDNLKSYILQIDGRDEDGNLPIDATTAPAAPTSLAANASAFDTVELTWTDASDNESGFVIERQEGSGSFTEIGTASLNFTSFTDDTAQPSTSYTYRVKATNSIGDSSWSNTASVTTPAMPLPTITSDTTDSAYQSVAYSYQITATAEPTSYGATGLPSWLSVNSSTGVVSGTPTATGTFTFDVSATNSSGTGSTTVTLTVTELIEADVYDSFDYTTGATLSGSNGGSGWSTSWRDDSTMQVSDTQLSYTDGNAVSLVTNGNIASTPTGMTGFRIRRDFDTSGGSALAAAGLVDGNGNIGADGTSVYMSFLIKRDNPNSGWWALEWRRDGDADSDRTWLFRSDYALNIAGGNTIASGLGNSSNTHFIVMRVDYGATEDTIHLYVDPDLDAEPSSATITMTGADLSFDRFAIADYGATSQEVQLDEYRMAATWNQVTPSSGSAPSGYAAWATSRFGTADSGTNGGALSDPDGDGIQNLTEYALGGDPQMTDRSILPTIEAVATPSGTFLQLRVTRSAEATDVNFIVEVSSDLQTWNSGSGHTTIEQDTSTLLLVRDAVSVESGGKRFFRLRHTNQ